MIKNNKENKLNNWMASCNKNSINLRKSIAKIILKMLDKKYKNCNKKLKI